MALWNEGARQGNDTCMFFYAQTLEDPELGNDPVAAAIWYARAARLGHPGAIAWCEKRGLAWQDPEPSPATSPATIAAPDPTIRPSAEPGNGPDPTAD
jgi:TPR repeat protein